MLPSSSVRRASRLLPFDLLQQRTVFFANDMAGTAACLASVRQQADVDSIATHNGRQIQVLVWNYHDDLVTAPASPVHLSVKLPADFGTSAVVTRTLADETHGDAYTAWVAQGSPQAQFEQQCKQNPSACG